MKKREFFRLVKFGLFSISAGLIEMGVFALLNEITSWRYWPCYLIALMMSVLWNFFMNRKFTFRSNAAVTPALLKLLAYYAVFTTVSTWGGDILVEKYGWNEYLMTAINMLMNFGTEFLYQKYVVYRHQLDNR